MRLGVIWGPALVAAALLVPTPAQAAPVVVVDPAGDATGLDPAPPPADGAAESTDRPSEPELDLTGASFAADGSSLVITARVVKLAAPTGTGVSFRALFTYDGETYQLIAQRADGPFTAAISSGLFFRARQPQSPELACRDCNAKLDTKTSTITFKAAVASLSSGIRQHKASSPKLVAGKQLTGLGVLSQRTVMPLDRTVDVGRTVTVDATRATGTLTL
jgi:hypothetical protein